MSDMVRSLANLSVHPPASWLSSLLLRLEIVLDESESEPGGRKSRGQLNRLNTRNQMLMMKALKALGYDESDQ